MADLPTRSELFRRARAAALAVSGTRISAKEIDRPGSDANLLFAAVSLLGEETVTRPARAGGSCFEDPPPGIGRARVVLDRRPLPRNPAAPGLEPKATRSRSIPE